MKEMSLTMEITFNRLEWKERTHIVNLQNFEIKEVLMLSNWQPR